LEKKVKTETGISGIIAICMSDNTGSVSMQDQNGCDDFILKMKEI
jgi:hypothetical protein